MKARLFALGFIGIVSFSATTAFAEHQSEQVQLQLVTEKHLTPEQLRQAKVAAIKGYRPGRAQLEQLAEAAATTTKQSCNGKRV